MPRITVSNLKNSTMLQDLQSNQVRLQQPSIVEIGIQHSDIAHIEHAGTRMIIFLKTGEKIIVDNFFTAEMNTPHTLLFLDAQSNKVQANFNEKAEVIDYSAFDPNKTIAKNTSSASASTTTATSQAAEPTPTEQEDSGPSLLKIGLGVAAAEATYLLAFKDDDKSKSSTEKDILAPTISSAAIDADGKVITGVTEANAKIYATDKEGNLLGEAVADDKGAFTLSLNKEIINGALVTIKAKDQAGNESKGVILMGNKDTISPLEANAQVNDQGTIISGKAEANAKIYIYAADGKTLIVGPINTAKDGSFSITLAKALTLGEKVQILVEDAAGNKSKMVFLEAGKDTLSPEQPLIEVAKDGSVIHGVAEANAKINILNADGVVIATGQADATGKFSIALTPALGEKDTASIVVEDAAGNTSQSLNFKAGQDGIAPDIPVATLNTDGTIVTGTAEANAEIEVHDSRGNVIGTGTADKDGQYSITLKSALANNSAAKVYAIDAAGNKSNAQDIVGTKDTLAPTKVLLKSVIDDIGEVKGVIKAGTATDDARPKFEGTGEANATLTIYNQGVAIGSVKVNPNGTWSYIPDKDLALGDQNFTFSQMDASNNTSDMSDSFKFSIVAADTPPTTTTVNLMHDVHSLFITEQTLQDVLKTVAVNKISLPAEGAVPHSINQLLSDTDLAQEQTTHSLLNDLGIDDSATLNNDIQTAMANGGNAQYNTLDALHAKSELVHLLNPPNEFIA
ncbi:hypothetical protein EC844_10772 [Acinetobacter calcoaceticus]|uniref:BapA prefix-like domain-containing protein n=1 Tax=Acinetobacter calcoaceticus TaxID=471 RepID=A0A4V2R198_ACICA|nr:hypothetical protein EC844_10772 [Acinetobacter calcoaceticus]